MGNRKKQIRDIIENKASIIKMKKLAGKKCDAIVAPSSEAVKAFGTTSKALPEDTEDKLYRTIIANTYNFLDSHGDVHLNGTFSKSIQENNNPFFLADHEFKTTAKIGKVLSSYEYQAMFNAFGYDSPMMTMALLQDVEIPSTSKLFQQYKDGEINQHSVGMRYIKVDLAVDDEEYEEEFKLFKSLLPIIGNSEKAEELGYFFAVREAQLIETSAVLLGSNPLTGVFNDNQKAQELNKLIQNFGGIEKFNQFYTRFAEGSALHSDDSAGKTTEKDEPKETPKKFNYKFLIK